MIAFGPAEINVASNPFRRERAQNAVLAGVGLALCVSLCMLSLLLVSSRTEAHGLHSIINNQRADLARLQRAQGQYSTVLSQPKNANVFSESVLLNDLIARRSVSWTRVFEDLGTVLPRDMRLLSLRLPQVAAEDGTGRNRVQLDMVVGAQKPETVLAFLKKLASSKLFGDVSVMSEAPPTDSDPLHKYRLTVAYAQQL